VVQVVVRVAVLAAVQVVVRVAVLAAVIQMVPVMDRLLLGLGGPQVPPPVIQRPIRCAIPMAIHKSNPRTFLIHRAWPCSVTIVFT